MSVSKTELLAAIDRGWNDLNTYIQSLTEAQITQPTDAAGWTVKDHLMHLAVWEDGILALLEKQSRRERMGINAAMWAKFDFDEMNAAIQQRHRDKPLAEVLQAHRGIHQRLVDQIQAAVEEDLHRPTSYFDPEGSDSPLIDKIMGNTFGHYEEHIPWMDAIVK
ncbi:MAG: maleylpyruvate isomerase N-terminal domain-containing protein [Anaerolineae bacterium]|nr:maleylpyruvate isomerase N-terminal domain-containing protein [Anaerolineae bacterium]